jgi:enoyl-CoA hydratase/carnithine racemase
MMLQSHGLLLRACLQVTRVTRASFSTNTSPLVSWTVDEATRIGTITLESPKTFNALTVEMGIEFQSLIRNDIQSNVHINAVVLTGAGNNAFSAGGNADWLRGLKQNPVHVNADAMMSFYQSFLCIRTVPVPVIAALQGPAIGAGACLALACDLRISTRGNRQLGFTFSRLGIHSGMGGSHLLMRALGSSAKVNEILLTGKVLSGEEAYDLGIVNRLADDAKAEAYALAKEVARQNPLAVRSMIQTLRAQQDHGLQAALHREAYAQALCYNREDWGEGLDAALEKRDPVFHDYVDRKDT